MTKVYTTFDTRSEHSEESNGESHLEIDSSLCSE
jgi:hypothetical protein